MSGFVLDYMIKTNHGSNDFEAYFIKDCCAKTSQWALSSDLLDMSIMCVSAASAFVESNPSFVIFSPVAMNTDVFLVKADPLSNIGMTQNRAYQKELINKRFGETVNIVPMVSQGLPYALEKKELQAAVIDVTKAMLLDGDISPANVNGDYISYVLVVNKEFLKKEVFKKYVAEFNEATDALMGNQLIYDQQLAEYLGNVKFDEGVHRKWKVKLLSIEAN